MSGGPAQRRYICWVCRHPFARAIYSDTECEDCIELGLAPL